MTTTADALSDALVAALQAVAPAGAQVLDHEAIPFRQEDLPAGGVFAVFLFRDDPGQEDAPDSEFYQLRTAIFKVELRIPQDPSTGHLLHGTRAARKLIAQALRANPELGGGFNPRIGAVAVLVHETNSAIACCAVDVHVDYVLDPDL